MKYHKGDQIEITRTFDLMINPFMKLKLLEGSGAVILSRSITDLTYLIGRRGDSIRVKASLLEPNSKLEATTTKQYSHVIESGLTFGQAMDKLILHGYKITRKVWDGYWYMENIHYNGGKPQDGIVVMNHTHKVIMAKLKSGEFAVSSPYQEDMLATDWMVVK